MRRSLVHSERKDIVIKLDKTTPVLSEDVTSQKTLSQKGIFVGVWATEVTYRVTMEYEKSEQIQPK